MKELVFKTNSWHYQFAGYARGRRNWYPADDICGYTRQVLRGVWMMLWTFVLIYVVEYALVDIVLGTIFSFIMGYWAIGFVGTAVLLILGVIIAAILFLLAVEGAKDLYWHFKNKRRNNKPPKQDGFIKNAYLTWKDKYCARIKFVDEKNEGN